MPKNAPVQSYGVLKLVLFYFFCLFLKILDTENLKENKAPKTKHITVV